jgi:hypothetical protein
VFSKPLFETFIIFVAFAFQESQDSLAFYLKSWNDLFVKFFDKIGLYLFNLFYSFFLQKIIYDLFVCELNCILTILFFLIFNLLLVRNLSFWLRLFLRLFAFFMCLNPLMQNIRLKRSSLANLLFDELNDLVIVYLNFMRCYVLSYYLLFRFVLLLMFLLFFFYSFIALLYFALIGFLLDICFCLCLFFILWLVLASLRRIRINSLHWLRF